ncbi:hypothetical protein ACQK5W_11905 [Pantoea sp. FN060301]|uniref:hypothetical protein n=1 Tax=Pantoea sp. FN060301 TaxID=3420380 RepID=UPI003D16E19A
MPDYCFFKKGKHMAILERSDAEGASRLAGQGYKKQFEEISAPDTQRALARFADIRKEEKTTVHAFATGSAFIALTTGLLMAAVFILQ